ncbi:aminodeoxychorismate synthase, component I [Sphingobium sp. SCG-1]|uniref:aminodeoxychorismate synthase component I n=1 Tax=Sphingobium sp. SCG-1 TaxID=2072936 RepID=UPI000CD6823E|nr:aminodeoxychorismate synthase component I [Sphingobium sp. SCG-1]AUW56767.1 aminodeoxychorismate synthase, component I [Sphingobium sp. SCG-1]
MRLPDPPDPFILFDDARSVNPAPARLYRDPVELIVARDYGDVQVALDRIGEAADRGLHAAGYVGYDAAFALEPRLASKAPARGAGEMPLVWFGLFDGFRYVEPDDVPAMLPAPGSAGAGMPRPLIERCEYEAAFEGVQEAIKAGDTYQVNLTFPCEASLLGDPRAIYAALRPHARSGYGGIVYTGEDWLLSFSPELFFTLVRGQLTARPMKGTALRGRDAATDEDMMAQLRNDPKQRAENLMIVDLLRNDLSRVSLAGSVTVPELFHVETFPTVHQMTSTVRARILPGLSAIDVLRTIFPCGSITGAPKVRAMEVIADIEHAARGPYTGAIGRIDADGNAAFNVAIRTISVKDGANTGRIGLGSGVVVDSLCDAEWRECLDKGRFLTPLQTDME